MKKILLSLVAFLMLSSIGFAFSEVGSYVDLNKIEGLTFDGTNFWATTTTTPYKLLKLDTSFNVVSSNTISISTRSISYANGYIYAVSSDRKKIYKLSTTGTILNSFSTAKTSSGGYGYIYADAISYNSDDNKLLAYSGVEGMVYAIDLNCALTYHSTKACNQKVITSLNYLKQKDIRIMAYKSGTHSYLIFGGKNRATGLYEIFNLNYQTPWVDMVQNTIETTQKDTWDNYAGGSWDGQNFYFRTKLKDCQGLSSGLWFYYQGGCYGRADATTCLSLGGQVKSFGICWKVPDYNNGKIYAFKPETF